MDILLKAAAGVLIAAIINVACVKQSKEISVLLVLAVCAMVATITFEFLDDIIVFLRKLESIGNLNHSILTILLKSVGIAILAEITTLICADSGNNAFGKVLQMLATVMILWLSLPVFTQLIDLTQEILGAV